jgi:hypothetical protein
MRAAQDSGDGRRGGRGGRAPRDEQAPSTEGIDAWFAGRLPEGWTVAELTVDRDEVLVVVRVDAPEQAAGAEGDDAARAAAAAGRLSRFREETREVRMQVAREAEHRYGRSVAWGAEVAGTRQVFTNLSVPVMTRLRQQDRLVLDTLVDSGVARSRSEALAWCVRLVGRNADGWLADLRQAMQAVQQVRDAGPQSGPAA